MTDQPSVTIAAGAAVTLGETMTIAAPAEWHDRIRALAARTCYGPSYSRQVVAHLADLSVLVRRGYSTLAYDRLLLAEEAAQ